MSISFSKVRFILDGKELAVKEASISIRESLTCPGCGTEVANCAICQRPFKAFELARCPIHPPFPGAHAHSDCV